MKIIAPFYRPLGKFFLLFLIFSDACSSFLRSRLVQLLFLFSLMRRGNQIDDAEPNLRQLSSTMTRSRKETQGTN